MHAYLTHTNMLPTESLLTAASDAWLHGGQTFSLSSTSETPMPSTRDAAISHITRIMRAARAMKGGIESVAAGGVAPGEGRVHQLRTLIAGMHPVVSAIRKHPQRAGKWALSLWSESQAAWVLACADTPNAVVKDAQVVAWGSPFRATGFMLRVTHRPGPPGSQYMGRSGREFLWRKPSTHTPTPEEKELLAEWKELYVQTRAAAAALARRLGELAPWNPNSNAPFRKLPAAGRRPGESDAARLSAAIPPAAGFTAQKQELQGVRLWPMGKGDDAPGGDAAFENLRKGTWERCKASAEELSDVHVADMHGLHTRKQLRAASLAALRLVRRMRTDLRYMYMAAGISRWVRVDETGGTPHWNAVSGILKSAGEVSVEEVGDVHEGLAELTSGGFLRNAVWGYYFDAAASATPHRWTAMVLAGALRRLVAIARGGRTGGVTTAEMLMRSIPIDLAALARAYGYELEDSSKLKAKMGFIDMAMFCARCIESRGLSGIVAAHGGGKKGKKHKGHHHSGVLPSADVEEQLQRIIMMGARVHRHGQVQLLRFMAGEGTPPDVVHDVATYLFEWGQDRVSEFMRDAAHDWSDPIQVAYQELQGYGGPWLSRLSHERVSRIAAACGGPKVAPHAAHTYAPDDRAAHAERCRREAALSIACNKDAWSWMAPLWHGAPIRPGVLSDHAAAAAIRGGIVPWMQETKDAAALRSFMKADGAYGAAAAFPKSKGLHASRDGGTVVALSSVGEGSGSSPFVSGDAAKEAYASTHAGGWSTLDATDVVGEQDLMVAAATAHATVDHEETDAGSTALVSASGVPTVQHPHVQASLKFVHVMLHLGYKEGDIHHMLTSYMRDTLHTPHHLMRSFWDIPHPYIDQLRSKKHECSSKPGSSSAEAGKMASAYYGAGKVAFVGAVSWDGMKPALPPATRGPRGGGSLTDSGALYNMVRDVLRLPKKEVLLE